MAFLSSSKSSTAKMFSKGVVFKSWMKASWEKFLKSRRVNVLGTNLGFFTAYAKYTRQWSDIPGTSTTPDFFTLSRLLTNTKSIRVLEVAVTRVGSFIIWDRPKGSMTFTWKKDVGYDSGCKKLVLKSPVIIVCSYFVVM